MTSTLRAIPVRAVRALNEFFKLEAAGGMLLILAAVAAMICANSPLDAAYDRFLGLPVEVRVGALQIAKPLLLWINDGLMAVFFLLVALEIKREAMIGQLASAAQRALPLACALGGILAPAAIYLAFNHGDEAALQGWAIPTATDIAFALGVLALLGSRAPLSLKVLLAAIAVIDDLAAIVIIALFYTADLSWQALLGALVALSGLIVLNRFGVRRIAPYLLLGVAMWICVLKSGVHATLAGVATGLLIPLGDPDDPEDAPLETLEHALHPWVAYAILPLFAFANAGLSLGGGANASGIGVGDLLHPVPLGIALGLWWGKTAGVFGAAWIAVKLGTAQRPDDVSWSALFGLALLCGIGFTMSLFIGSLAFEHGATPYAESNRLGILVGSVLAALSGLFWLWRALPRAPAAA
jgi:NhaA family Na+:H+ antiporter